RILISIHNHPVETDLEAPLRGGVAFAQDQDDKVLPALGKASRKGMLSHAKGVRSYARSLENDLGLELTLTPSRQTLKERAIRPGRGSRLAYDLSAARLRPRAGCNCRTPGTRPNLVRALEVRVVKDVVDVRAHRERHSLPDLEILIHREIRVKESRPAVLVASLCGEIRQRVGRGKFRRVEARAGSTRAALLGRSERLGRRGRAS